MYLVDCEIEGLAPLLQHRFVTPELANLTQGGRRVTGAVDYTEEWRGYLYVTPQGEIGQPAVHIEQSLIKAAGSFKITGRRGATYRDLFKASVFVTPELLSHGVASPETLTTNPEETVYLDMRPVVIQKARVVRIRPALKKGWRLSFTIEVMDDQIPVAILKDVLELAGKTGGIGDHRPRFGRFMVTGFQKQDAVPRAA
jgi:hypothetical protein